MTRPRKWRCGRKRFHEGGHGDWQPVEKYKKEKWRCGMVAKAPAAHREGHQFNCPWEDCDALYLESGPARRHWYTHIHKAAQTFTAEHGTVQGYWNHRRLEEEACQPCKTAHTQYNRKWRSQYASHPHPNPPWKD